MIFLTIEERNIMRLAFRQLLRSKEAVLLEIHYGVPNGPLVLDPIYGSYYCSGGIVDTVAEPEVPIKAIQEIIVPSRHYDILKFGFMESGDCIFYINETVDLKPYLEYGIGSIMCQGVEWVPVPREHKEFYNYLSWRVGDGQIAQIIPCKTKKN